MTAHDEESQKPLRLKLFSRQMSSEKETTPGRNKLEEIIDEMFWLLEERGFERVWPFRDRCNPVESYPRVQTDYALAGMAITHSKAAIRAIEMNLPDLAAMEALHAERLRARANSMGREDRSIQSERKFKYPRSAVSVPKQFGHHDQVDHVILARRREILIELQKNGVWRGYYPRYLLATERGVPVDEIDVDDVAEMRNYLRRNGLGVAT